MLTIDYESTKYDYVLTNLQSKNHIFLTQLYSRNNIYHMNNTTIKNKIVRLEAELKLLKSSIFSAPIDFEADEKIWKMYKPISKKIRSQLYKKQYA